VISVLVVDDHAVVRQGLRTFLELQDDIEVVGEAGDGAAALEAVARLTPDVVLMDLVMPRLGGVRAIERLRVAAPATRVIVLTNILAKLGLSGPHAGGAVRRARGARAGSGLSVSGGRCASGSGCDGARGPR